MVDFLQILSISVIEIIDWYLLPLKKRKIKITCRFEIRNRLVQLKHSLIYQDEHGAHQCQAHDNAAHTGQSYFAPSDSVIEKQCHKTGRCIRDSNKDGQPDGYSLAHHTALLDHAGSVIHYAVYPRKLLADVQTDAQYQTVASGRVFHDLPQFSEVALILVLFWLAVLRLVEFDNREAVVVDLIAILPRITVRFAVCSHLWLALVLIERCFDGFDLLFGSIRIAVYFHHHCQRFLVFALQTQVPR